MRKHSETYSEPEFFSEEDRLARISMYEAHLRNHQKLIETNELNIAKYRGKEGYHNWIEELKKDNTKLAEAMDELKEKIRALKDFEAETA